MPVLLLEPRLALDIELDHNQVAAECQSRKLLFYQFQTGPAELHLDPCRMEQFLFAGLQKASQNLEQKFRQESQHPPAIVNSRKRCKNLKDTESESNTITLIQNLLRRCSKESSKNRLQSKLIIKNHIHKKFADIIAC